MNRKKYINIFLYFLVSYRMIHLTYVFYNLVDFVYHPGRIRQLSEPVHADHTIQDASGPQTRPHHTRRPHRGRIMPVNLYTSYHPSRIRPASPYTSYHADRIRPVSPYTSYHLLLFLIKEGRQCKAERESYTPYQS